MSEPKITIFTCSYNKINYVADAINSVLSQTFPDFEYIILENSTDKVTNKFVHRFKDKRIRIIDIKISKKIRNEQYPESYLKNNYSDIAAGEYIMYLADDDILMPNCFEEHVKDFEENKSHKINFHGYQVSFMGTDKPDEIRLDGKNRGHTTRRRPGRRVDGGSVMFDKDLLKLITKPYFKLKWEDAHISDGLFLNRLAVFETFYPINKVLHTKRITEVSTHDYIDKNGNPNTFRRV